MQLTPISKWWLIAAYRQGAETDGCSVIQVDVIVNTVGYDLDLSQGAVSSSLLAAAGPALQAECRTLVPAGQKVSAGQVIRTAGHQLKCKDVLHAASIKWDAGAGQCEKVAQSLS